jgi:hypothetical protein
MVVGPGTYLNSLNNAILELQMTRDASPAGNRAHGFCGYSYNLPYASGTWTGFSPSLLSQVTPAWDDLPAMPWKTAPTNGHLMGRVTLAGSGAWADHATVAIAGPASRSQFVDGTGFYAFIDLPPGGYTLTASKSGYANAQATASVALGVVTGNMYEQNFVLSPPSPPTITAPPQSLTVVQGSNASFTVSASAQPTPAYQWRFNSANLAGATASAYTRSNAQPAHVGGYAVVVSNSAGSVTSSMATLTVIPPEPADFELTERLPDGRVRLGWTGGPDRAYFLQAATNLSFTNAILLGPVSGSNGWFDFVDDESANLPRRFYRTQQ